MPNHSWIARIRKGDVLRAGSGLLRVVRHVSHSTVKWNGPAHTRTNVYFSIKHCSWTHRCYTVYTGNDLVQMGYRPTRARVKLRKKIDRIIEHDITNRDRFDQKLTCCDVESVS